MELRGRIFDAFEIAELEIDNTARRPWITFAVGALVSFQTSGPGFSPRPIAVGAERTGKKGTQGNPSRHGRSGSAVLGLLVPGRRLGRRARQRWSGRRSR